MRIYVNAQEAYEEIKRDLMEMGIEVKPKTMQDKHIEGNPDYYTKELQNYSYCLLDAKSKDIIGVAQPWADAEFQERIMDPWGVMNYYSEEEMKERFGVSQGDCINPGKAYKLRPEVWNEYLHDGKFGYTYNELIWQNHQLAKIVNRIKIDPDSRQLWLSLWNPDRDPSLLGGLSRVPCSLGYAFQVREGKLNMHYIMRSCDFATFFPNDVYLAIKLLEYVSKQVNIPVGSFTHTIFSLHVYHKDIKGVF